LNDFKKIRILFLCTGNSCRSQMAEGWARYLKGNIADIFSAGIIAKGVDLRAVKVMVEAGVDILTQKSKTIDELESMNYDYVITLCSNAEENCPFFPGNVKRIHFGFDDPPKLAEHEISEENALKHYRRVRDEIKAFVEKIPDILN
jgi:arsenate reductase (thioredoxin)